MKQRLYLYRNGTLKRQDNSLVFIHKQDKEYIPILQLEMIFVFGHLDLNKEVLQILSVNNIAICFFNYYGNYFGSFQPKERRIGIYLIKQVEFYNNELKKFKVMKEIIITSIDNMLALLKYYRKKGVDLTTQIIQIEYNKEKIDLLDVSEQKHLTMYEAQSKQTYYSCINSIVKNRNFRFSSRTVNPPKDEINALMSFGYSILYSLFENIIWRSNLEISLPFIHGVTRSEGGLQYDLADIFKPVLIDRLIFRLINKQQISSNCFCEKDNGVYLNKEGANIFIVNFEETLNKTIRVNDTKSYSYRSLLSREVHKLSRTILKEKEFKGFRMRW